MRNIELTRESINHGHSEPGIVSMRRQNERGSTMLEFGLVIILFMTMFLGIMDFGRALYWYHFVAHAARDATRWAAVNGQDCTKDSSCDGVGYMNNGVADQSAIQAYVASITPLNGIKASDVSCGGALVGVCATWPGDGTAACTATPKSPGCPVQVTVSYTLDFISTLVHKTSITMSSSSQMVIAH